VGNYDKFPLKPVFYLYFDELDAGPILVCICMASFVPSLQAIKPKPMTISLIYTAEPSVSSVIFPSIIFS